MKYWKLLSLSWQNGLVYRVSVFMWRIRQFLSTIMSLTVWSVVFVTEGSKFGYTGDQMISYVFLVSLLQSVVLASVLYNLAGTIYSGEISNYLIKPINVFVYLGIVDLADKLKNFTAILIEFSLLLLLFKPVFSVPSWDNMLIFIVWVLGAIILNFGITLLFGALGFWSPDTWGPRFLFFMFLDFTAGKLFPLDILPKTIQSVIFATPFPYLSFVQTQLYLGKYDTARTLHHSFVLVCWIIGVFAVVTFVWKRGLREYGAAGR